MDGEFGIKDVAMDMICRIGKNGIEELVDSRLTNEQQLALNETAVRMLQMEEKIGII